MNNIKGKIKKITPLNRLYTNLKWRRRRVTYGNENKDKTFYVIRRAQGKAGLFSYFATNLGHIDYAVKKGYIPVVDMQNEKNVYITDEQIGKINAWELYFKQPCGYGLNDIKNSNNIILSNGLINGDFPYPNEDDVLNTQNLAYWRELSHKYIIIKDDLKKEFEEYKKELFKGERVLGVLARGTDYAANKPSKHRVQPTYGQLSKKVHEVMVEYGCERLYLATEDENIYESFKNEFKESLIAPDTKRYSTTTGQNINDIIIQESNDLYIQGKEYLKSIWLLSECNCLVGGNAGGTLGAMLLSDGFEYSYIFDLGIYP